MSKIPQYRGNMGIKEKVEIWSGIAVSNYVNNSKCMNKTIADVAHQEAFNNKHIDIGFAFKHLS
jgi:hypothetical protein